ncbi:MAG: hypothetical protein A2076_15470 [Geobacteraceae bacterium GWC2_53_11]|nr:MAG: hypothetical protein A2076_15470 [Geobacteraceae bacterium GWC2_53_11]
MNRLIVLFVGLLLVSCLCRPLPGMAAEPADAGKFTPPAIPASSAQKAAPKPKGHLKDISLFVLSKDGRLAVTADEDENNYIWDMKNGKLLREIGKPEAVRINVVTAAFSPEASQLLWARRGKIMPVMWDVESGRRIGVLSSREKGHNATIVAMTYSSDGRYIATGDSQGFVVIWNRADRSVVRRIKAHSGEARYLAFIPGKNELATAGVDGAVRLWGTTGTEAIATLLEPSDYEVTALTSSSDGQILYAALEDMTIKGWAVPLRRLRGTLDFNNRLINSIALSPDGDFMAIAEEDESVQLWNIHAGKTSWKSELDGSVTQVSFSPDGKRLYTSGGDNWIREWDSATGHLVRKFGGAEQ